MVNNRDWARVRAELGAAIPPARVESRRQPDGESRDINLAPEADADALLQHIAEALQKDGDKDC